MPKYSEEAKKRNQQYIREYNKQNYKRITLMVPKSNEDVIEKLSSVPSMSAYILELIEKDLKK